MDSMFISVFFLSCTAKDRIMGKRILFYIAVLAAVSSCGRRGNGMTEQEVADYGEIGYADIVSFIVQGFQCHWDSMNPEDQGLSPIYRYESPYAGYVETDIDGDGVKELLIGDEFEDGNVILYDIFTISRKDASLIHLASGNERDMFTVTGEGIIVEDGSNSAFDSFTRGFRLKNGNLDEVKNQAWHETAMKLNLENFKELADSSGTGSRLCGGYTGGRAPSDEELDMFRTVAGGDGVVYTPISVSTQVVAGTNYRFLCNFREGKTEGRCTVTIWKPLHGQGDARVISIERE